MSFVDKEIGTMKRHPRLHGGIALAGDVTRRHDNVSTAEDAVHLVRRRGKVLQGADYRGSCASLEDVGPWELQDPEREEFMSELLSQGVSRDDNEKLFAIHGNQNRKHGLRLACAGGYHNCRGRFRNRPMSAAFPIIVTFSGDSSLGPTVDLPQPSNEQRQPARAATAFLVFLLKSSRLLIHPALPAYPR
jgi:hypothetical protein